MDHPTRSDIEAGVLCLMAKNFLGFSLSEAIIGAIKLNLIIRLMTLDESFKAKIATAESEKDQWKYRPCGPVKSNQSDMWEAAIFDEGELQTVQGAASVDGAVGVAVGLSSFGHVENVGRCV